jgi:phosphohistidine phosphatase
MILYLVRHAIAVPHGTPGIAEDERPLTERGTRKMAEAAEGLRNIGVAPEVIVSSPLPRAKQTADILIEVLGGQASLKLLPALAPGGSRPEIYKELQTYRELECLMLVGHQPSLGEIAAEIAWGSPETYVELKKGGACALEVHDWTPPRGTLLWLLTPALLRKRFV